MVEWRDQGVVQDSDDDDLEDALTTVYDPGHVDTLQPELDQRQVAQLQANGRADGTELNLTASAKEDLPDGAVTPDPKDFNFFDLSDSPLSSIGATPPQASTAFATASLKRSTVSPLPHDQPEVRPFFDDPELSLFEQEFLTNRLISSRTFRPRNPIQLHPYRLEIEQYRQALRARGLQPVNVVNASQQHVTARESDESQPWFNETQQDTQSVYNSSRSQSPTGPTSNASPPGASDEHITRSDHVRSGFKRRRLNEDEDSATSTDLGLPVPNPVKAGKAKFRMPLGVRPLPLPTPDTSSEPAAPQSIDEQQHLPSPRPSTSRHRRTVVITSSDSSSSEDETYLRRVQKRIRGVLPASWLRLDKHTTRPAAPRPTSPSRQPASFPITPKPESALRGVAKRVHRETTSRSTLPLPEIHDVWKDDEPSSDESVTVVQANVLTPITNKSLDRHKFVGEVVEENWVDPMLPDRVRRPINAKRKRQSKLTDAFSRQNDISATLSSGHRRPKDSKTRHKGRPRERPKKPRQVHLSILDIMPEEKTIQLPNFVRVAARTATRRRDYARQSPSRKQVSLHKRDEGVEVDNVLNAWRSGKIRQSSSRPSRPRASSRVLQERSQNRQTRLPYPLVEPRKEADDRFSEEPRRRSTGVPIKRRHAQTQLEAIDDPNIENSATMSSQKKATIPNPPQQRLQRLLKARAGQLEELELGRRKTVRRSDFERGLAALDADERAEDYIKWRTTNPLMPRFLSDDEGQSAEHPIVRKRRRRLKQKPSKLDTSAIEVHRQPENTTPVDQVYSVVSQEVSPLQSLRNLSLYGTSFPIDFGVSVLPIGLSFHRSTFIGQQRLIEAMNFDRRDMDDIGAAGYTTIRVSGDTFKLGPWNQETASALTKVLKSVDLQLGNDGSADTSSVDKTLTSVIDWITRHLVFSDPVDRLAFSKHMNPLLDLCSQRFEDVRKATKSASYPRKLLHCQTLLYVLSSQLLKIAGHETVTIDALTLVSTSNETKENFSRFATSLMRNVLNEYRHDLQAFHNHSNLIHLAEAGIKESSGVAVEAIVCLNHLQNAPDSPVTFWELVMSTLTTVVNVEEPDVVNFEDCWCTIFSLLPLLDIDADGVYRRNNLHAEPLIEDWSVVKQMTQTVLQASASTPNANAYIRATLARCFQLIQDWSWNNCETILFTMFDFFAQHGLNLLTHEESTGPTAFLDNLQPNFRLRTSSSDRTFQLFLKCLAAGLHGMQRTYSTKRIKNLVWRFVPNHGRTHSKELELQQRDLDALRNHHELLSVLYFAPPPAARISLKLIRNLVNLEASHMEVVRLNVRAWSNMTKFQLLTINDTADDMIPFADWLNDILKQLAMQHRLARSEAESFFQQAGSLESVQMSRDTLEKTVKANQRQIESVLGGVLASLSSCLAEATDRQAAMKLFNEAGLHIVFGLFDPQVVRTNSIILEALQVYRALFGDNERSRTTNTTVQQDSEESQDYGGDALFDDLVDDSSVTSSEISNAQFAALQQLLSNCFGAESCTDDPLLTMLVDTWVKVAKQLIKSGQHDWSHFISPHSSSSWSQLRDTHQTRAYGPYFLASVLRADPSCAQEDQQMFLSVWLMSLVDRDLNLKYQHLLTKAIMDSLPGSEVLQNLPFVRSNRDGSVNITLQDIRERRLLILSMVFSNMRFRLEDATIEARPELEHIRRDYQFLLTRMMTAMKDNYLETFVGSTARGAFVDFVHRVVELLQQYTAEICPVLKFFTDSSAFPLPAHDPTYLIGRLRSYGVKSDDVRMQKQLATFVQSACERAVIDGQQEYLISQLIKSVEDQQESATAEDRPTLRSLLLQAVLPAYIQDGLTSHQDCGWLFVQPVLKVYRAIFSSLLQSLADLTSPECLKKADGQVSTFLTAVCSHTLQVNLDQTEQLEAHELSTISGLLETAAATVPIIDFTFRSSRHQKPSSTARQIAHLAKFALHIIQHLTEGSAPSNPTLSTTPKLTHEDDSPFQEIRRFSTSELHETLRRRWSSSADGRCLVKRAGALKEVDVASASHAEALQQLLTSARQFVQMVANMPAFHALLRR